MAAYLHYSFDLWLTLIRSNPAFKQQRVEHFYRHYNHAQKSREEINIAFRQVDVMVNAINEKTGKNIDADELYLMVLSIINDYQLPLHDIDIQQLCADMDTLLLNYMPVVYCSQTAAVLGQLKQQDGCTLSLLSNTGFIRGQTLRQVLQHLQLDQFLSFQLYSDETGLSKPNPQFFKLMLVEVALYNKNAQPAHIIHIGDNKNADIEGAKMAGLQSRLINSNQQCITCLLN
ncbi:HAD family hydrolase [Mucilaginibacter sp.]